MPALSTPFARSLFVKRTTHAIVGAGLAGLSAAHTLARAGASVVVYEQQPTPGGRMATRQTEHGRFDHGAQYFSVRDPRFATAVETWFAAGAVAPWPGRIATWRDGTLAPVNDSVVRYVATPGMNRVAELLSQELAVHFNTAIRRISRQDGLWLLHDAEGTPLCQAEQLVLATPPAEAASLLGAYPELVARLGAVVMQPCWAMLLTLAEPLPFLADGVFVHDSPLSWIARDDSKPGRSRDARRETWVLHASADFSRRNQDKLPEMIIPELGAAFARVVHDVVRPKYAEACLWRQALPDPALDAPFLRVPELGLALAGDWCGGPRVEGAYLSGLRLAEALLGR